MDDVLGEEESDSDPEAGSDPTTRPVDVAELDAKVWDGPNVLGYIDPPGQTKPDVSALIPSQFRPPLPTDSPQSLFVNKLKKDPAPNTPVVNGERVFLSLFHYLAVKSFDKRHMF